MSEFYVNLCEILYYPQTSTFIESECSVDVLPVGQQGGTMDIHFHYPTIKNEYYEFEIQQYGR